MVWDSGSWQHPCAMCCVVTWCDNGLESRQFLAKVAKVSRSMRTKTVETLFQESQAFSDLPDSLPQHHVASRKQELYVIDCNCVYNYINLLQMDVLWGFGQVWGFHLIWKANLCSSGRHCECAGTGLWRYGSLAVLCAVFCVESASSLAKDIPAFSSIQPHVGYSSMMFYAFAYVFQCVSRFPQFHCSEMCFRPWLCHLKRPHGCLQEASRMVSPCVDAVMTGLAWLDCCLKMFQDV